MIRRRRLARTRALIALMLLLTAVACALLALHRADPDLMVRRLDPAGEAVSAQPGPAGGTGAAGQPAATTPQPESRFAVIALRPLFTAGRRPPAEPEAAAIEEAEPPDMLVTGIVMAGGDSVAILEPLRPRSAQANSALVVHAGDTVAGWRVEAIEPALVVLARDGVRHELPLVEEDDPRRPGIRRAPVPGQPRVLNPQPQTQQLQQQKIQQQPIQPRQPALPSK